MIEISKYENYLDTTEYEPELTYKQVDNNLTAAASLLLSIDSLDEKECLVIRKIEQ